MPTGGSTYRRKISWSLPPTTQMSLLNPCEDLIVNASLFHPSHMRNYLQPVHEESTGTNKQGASQSLAQYAVEGE